MDNEELTYKGRPVEEIQAEVRRDILFLMRAFGFSYESLRSMTSLERKAYVKTAHEIIKEDRERAKYHNIIPC